jgi:hypothetical protein
MPFIWFKVDAVQSFLQRLLTAMVTEMGLLTDTSSVMRYSILQKSWGGVGERLGCERGVGGLTLFVVPYWREVGVCHGLLRCQTFLNMLDLVSWEWKK